jgi:sortase A
MPDRPQTPGARGGAGGPESVGAVRLLDEHERRVVVLKLDAAARAEDPAARRPSRPRRSRERATRVLALVLIALGAVALTDAVVTLVWQEPFSALYAKLRQDHLSGVLRKEEKALPTPVERRALGALTTSSARIAFLASSLQRRAPEGSPVGRIRIPRLGVDFVIVNGTSTSALQSGPGVFPETVFPGRGGTTAIAGHRTTYLAPFRHIDELSRGDRIVLEMPYAHFSYEVTGSAVVAPTDVAAATSYVGHPRLVLSACTPPFSAAKRLLVYARLAHTAPVRAGVAPLRSGARIPQAQPLRRARLEAIPPASP